MITPTRTTATLDRETTAVIGRVKIALQASFGERLEAVYLFGSRARGDHHSESDVDLAVFLRDDGKSLGAQDQDLIEATYPVELDLGIHLQTWALPAGALQADRPSPRAKLVETVRRDGIRL
ncbi:MAG TPA: nucleotidyltransferase domain-containing protein [Stellaceae bacterium]|nr:nucleotidyltransferase domain-containing protein [Stellaceae bacterium]